MADDTAKTDPTDRERINVNESYELEYWSKKFAVTPDELKKAVAKLGVMSKDIAKHFGKTG